MTINLPVIEWRDYQKKQLIARKNGCKRFYKVWHRRAGKDITDINFTVMQAMERVGVYWHLLPEYKQARKAVWQGRTADGKAYVDYFPEEIVARRRDQEMQLELVNGSIWQIVGSDNIDAMRGAGPVGIVLSEYAFTNPSAWSTIEPILMENGGWAVFNTTPYGENHAKELWDLAIKNENWFTQLLTIEDTSRENGEPIVTQEMLEELRRMGTSEESIQREYFCSWKGSVEGSYYSEQIRKLYDAKAITRVPYDPQFPVRTYWDIGISDYTSIWFVQKVGLEFRIINYHQENGKAITHYADILRLMDYEYEEHFLPHDAGHRQLATGKSIKAQMEDILPRQTFTVLKRTSSVQADIMATRSFLPRCVFDEAATHDGVKALQSYTKRWSDKKNAFDDSPLHNWASHAADAFRYLATHCMEETSIERPSEDRNGLPTFAGAMKNRSRPRRL